MDQPSRQERRIAVAICAAFALQCFGYALLLPPFEGFDETAHFSYISLLADRGEIPDFRWTPLDARVERAARELPQRSANNAPYEAHGELTYKQFFTERSASQRQAAARRFWQGADSGELPTEYLPGRELNWQGQHPPLFYGLLTLPYRLTAGQPLGVQLSALRLAAVTLACGSAWFWWLTFLRFAERYSRWAWLAGGATVLALPSCWFDLGRLGNDSLAACCLAAVVYYLLRVTESRRRLDQACLALACTCGLLTKAFFIPVTAAALCYVFVSGAQRDGWRRALLEFLAAGLLIALGAGWWFALYSARYGMLLGSHETWLAAQQATLPGDGLSVGDWLLALRRGAGGFLLTFMWSGTWSWVRRPDAHYLSILPLLMLCLAGAWLGFRERRQRLPGRLHLVALVLLIPLLCGLASHIILCIRMTGRGSGAGGYYLFFAWPLVGVLLSSFWNCCRGSALRWLAIVALVSAMWLEWSGLWFCLQVYTGVIEKTAYSPIGAGGAFPTPGNIATAIEDLSFLAFPRVAFACLAIALIIKIRLWSVLATSFEGDPLSQSYAPHPIRSTRQVSS